MGRAEKRLERVRASPLGWRYDELAGILEGYGFTLHPHGGGSHRIFKHPSGARIGLVDSGSGTLLPAYARAVVKVIDSLPKGDNDEAADSL
jgi:predicted RNA binding protein YcfA (HicA-like mRNA interferase family)